MRKVLLWFTLMLLGIAVLLGCGVPGFGGGGDNGGGSDTGGTRKQFKVWHSVVRNDSFRIAYEIWEINGSSVNAVDSNDNVYSYLPATPDFGVHDGVFTKVNGQDAVVSLWGSSSGEVYMCLFTGDALGQNISINPASDPHCHLLSEFTDSAGLDNTLRVNPSDSDNNIIVYVRDDTNMYFYKLSVNDGTLTRFDLTMPVTGMIRDIFVGFGGVPANTSYPWIVMYDGSGIVDMSSSFTLNLPIDKNQVHSIIIGGLDSYGKVGVAYDDSDYNTYFTVCDYYGYGIDNCATPYQWRATRWFLKGAIFDIGDNYKVLIEDGFWVIRYDYLSNTVEFLGSHSYSTDLSDDFASYVESM